MDLLDLVFEVFLDKLEFIFDLGLLPSSVSLDWVRTDLAFFRISSRSIGTPDAPDTSSVVGVSWTTSFEIATVWTCGMDADVEFIGRPCPALPF